MSPYLLNTWYVAAWSDELPGPDQPKGGLFSRRLLDQPVLLYRREDGTPVALTDRCPHRFVPLHLGKRLGDDIQCAYHGLRFDAEGRCVHNPNSDTIPKAAKVRAYPVVERDRLLWIWMGDAERADATLIPDFGFMADDTLATVKGYLHGDSHYLLMVDNILDLTHTQYLHADTLGSEALAKVPTKVVEGARHVDVLRWMPDDYQAPLTAASRGFAGRKADTWNDIRWHVPSYMHMDMGMTEPGTPRSAGKMAHSLHLITPETATTNHYFWANARAFAVDDAEMSEQIRKGFSAAFEFEDKPILKAQQESMGDAEFWSLSPVLLQGDAGAVRVRRHLDKLIAQEQQAGTAAAAPKT